MCYLKTDPTTCIYYVAKTDPTTCIYYVSKFLYSQVTFRHVSVATTTTIIREVHLHQPKHRYFKLSYHAHCQNHFASPSVHSLMNTDKQHFCSCRTTWNSIKLSSSSSVICQMTGPKPLPKRFLHIVRSRASSFN